MSESRSRPSGSWLGLEGARVVVAGAGGIGAVCAQAYAGSGAEVLVVDRDEARIAATIAADASPGRLLGYCADVTERGAGTRMVDEACRALGGLDVLLHCVGVNDRRGVLEITEDDWEHIVRINLTSAFALGQAAGRHMVSQRQGRIVFLSSVSGLLAHAKHAPYAASKGGLNQLMRVMAREWAPEGVAVNAVAPGYLDTQLTAAYLAQPGIREGLEAMVPAGRLGTPEEIVGAVLFLSSRQAAFVTGHVLYVDGGRTLV